MWSCIELVDKVEDHIYALKKTQEESLINDYFLSQQSFNVKVIRLDNEKDFSNIISIKVILYTLEKSCVYLHCSDLKTDAVYEVCVKYFKPLDFVRAFHGRVIIINNIKETSICQLIQILKDLGEFTPEISTGLSRLKKLLSSSKETFASCYSDEIFLDIKKGNDQQSGSIDLLSMMLSNRLSTGDDATSFDEEWLPKDEALNSEYLVPFSTKEYAKKLARGSDSNQHSAGGATPLFVAIEYKRDDLISVLLTYGANPFKRFSGICSAFEKAFADKKTNEINTIIAFFSRPAKPLGKLEVPDTKSLLAPPQKKLSQVLSVRRQIIDDALYTNLRTIDGNVTFILRETDSLSKNEIDEVFDLYKNFFEESPICRTSSREFFEYDIKGNLKFVEYVVLNHQLVAVHIAEIVILEEYPQNIYFHISCVFAKESVRGKGFSNPLLKTFGDALQVLFPDKNIIRILQCISPGSLEFVKNTTYFPLYKLPFFTQDMMQKLIAHIQRNPNPLLQNEPPILVQDEPTCYTVIESQVRDVKHQKEERPVHPKEFVLDHLHRGITHPQQQKHHAALIGSVITDETWKADEKLYEQMNLNRGPFTHNYAAKLRFFLQKLKPQLNTLQTVSLPRSKPLLYNNKRIPSNTCILAAPDGDKTSETNTRLDFQA